MTKRSDPSAFYTECSYSYFKSWGLIGCWAPLVHRPFWSLIGRQVLVTYWSTSIDRRISTIQFYTYIIWNEKFMSTNEKIKIKYIFELFNTSIPISPPIADEARMQNELGIKWGGSPTRLAYSQWRCKICGRGTLARRIYETPTNPLPVRWIYR